EDDDEEEEGGGEEEGDDGCLDDWEAVADALAANDKCQNPCSDSPPSHGDESIVQMASSNYEDPNRGPNSGSRNLKLESANLVLWTGNCQAWRADDAFRPQSFLNLSKQHSLPISDRRCGGGVLWSRSAMPSSCPICCEDLDLIDTSFLPC
ncbi:hypothetical protein S83_050267, partial [Arachis hypogaea]